jgi:hypothetical protein
VKTTKPVKDDENKLNGEPKRGPGRPRKTLALETDSVISGKASDKGESAVEGARTGLAVNPKVPEAAEEFSDMEANALLDLLQGIEQPAASKIYGVPYEITRQAFVFTDDMRKRINPAMVKILNKWAPTILRNWKDEVGFILVFGSALNMQIQTMHHLENKRKREAAATAPLAVVPIKPEKTDAVAKTEIPKNTAPVPPNINLPGKDSVDLDNVGVGL